MVPIYYYYIICIMQICHYISVTHNHEQPVINTNKLEYKEEWQIWWVSVKNSKN